MSEHFDVLIIGAGLSGIGMACHLTRDCPGKSFAILERRGALGGTWDLFRYPGIRSDSDMFSFGYSFRPWNELKVLADGPSIRSYLGDTAREYGVLEKIRYGLKITDANWLSAERQWQVTALEEASNTQRNFSCQFLVMCTGYYDYDGGYLPAFPGIEHFKGQRIHPQHWPEKLDYAGKRVVVIGSGATAVTLVPAMAAQAAHVTMLQRSPSYIFTVPSLDLISKWLAYLLPSSWVYALARRRNIFLQRLIYKLAKRRPALVRRMLMRQVEKQLPSADDLRHFTPHYAPWDERLCAVPDGDLFTAMRSGKAKVVTDEIETFTESGVLLKSGQTLDADLIITATGLQVQVLGGMVVKLDGVEQKLREKLSYKGLLAQDIPNMAWIFGYTNASWTLKADLSARYLCRLLKHMDAKGQKVATPRDLEGCATEFSALSELASGYVQRADAVLPRQGSKLPWRVLNQYERDKPMMLKEPVEDGLLEFLR